jgi:hypothetical protein
MFDIPAAGILGCNSNCQSKSRGAWSAVRSPAWSRVGPLSGWKIARIYGRMEDLPKSSVLFVDVKMGLLLAQ